jgi:ubiquinone/menaquinone biosynthesis C-methylase UbiE
MNITVPKPWKGIGMEGGIARWYARTRQNDMEDFRQEAKTVANRLTSGSRVLEVALGPGFFAIELAKLGDFKITGLDISRAFVQIASENARKACVEVEFRLGDASAMPFESGAFDFVYCAAAFKNFSEPIKALDEMHRVLRPGSEAVVADLRKDVSLDEIDTYVRQSGRARLDALLTKWAFRCLLIKRAYTRDAFARIAEKSRFGKYRIDAVPLGFQVSFMKA